MVNRSSVVITGRRLVGGVRRQRASTQGRRCVSRGCVQLRHCQFVFEIGFRKYIYISVLAAGARLAHAGTPVDVALSRTVSRLFVLGPLSSSRLILSVIIACSLSIFIRRLFVASH